MTTNPPADRSRRRRSAAAPALDRRAILAAALGLVDDEGLEALSMRKLGARLGVEAMTLYYYFPSKASLLQALAEAVLDGLPLPTGPIDDWPSAVREVARAFRRLGLAHPNVFPLLATVGLENPASHRPTEAILRALDSAGFDPELAFTAFATVKSFVVGHVLWILGDPLARGGECLPMPGSIPAEAFPRLATYLPRLAGLNPATEFERGLDLLVAGLDVLRSRRQPSPLQD